jgi:hypothetical protein
LIKPLQLWLNATVMLITFRVIGREVVRQILPIASDNKAKTKSLCRLEQGAVSEEPNSIAEKITTGNVTKIREQQLFKSW